MTQDSQHLHAQAAAWSLRAALSTLADRAAAEDRVIAIQQAAAADPLKSPLWGRRHALGGHGDPTGNAILTVDLSRANRYADLLGEVQGQLDGVAKHLPAAGHDPLGRIEAAIPAMSRPAAAATRRLLDRIDGRIRRLLHEPDDRQLLPRVRCPACDATALTLRTSAPPADRVIGCTTCDLAWTAAEMRGRITA